MIFVRHATARRPKKTLFTGKTIHKFWETYVVYLDERQDYTDVPANENDLNRVVVGRYAVVAVSTRFPPAQAWLSLKNHGLGQG